ncbi:MAG: hypothetical protein ABI968_15260 [Acidobacteriota bacterium]
MNARVCIAVTLASMASLPAMAADPTPAPTPTRPLVGDDAVWAAPADFDAKLHAACDKTAGEKLGECLLREMRKAGASPAAVAFAQSIDSQGYLRTFRETGRVDVAYVEYPFRANQNQLCFLVNGQPPRIDVDDLSRLDRASLERNAEYAAIVRNHPNAAIFPAARVGSRVPIANRMTNGGQRFVVTYHLRDGCHACALVGEVLVGFEFDVEGRFRETSVLRVRPRYP